MKKDTSDKPQLFLTNWQGFTEFDLSSVGVEIEPGSDSTTFLSIEALPDKTPWEAMLKKQAHSIISSINNFSRRIKALHDIDYDVLASGEEIEQRAAIIAEALSVWPSNSKNEERNNRSQEGLSEIDIQIRQMDYEMGLETLTDNYVSHLTVLFDTDVCGDDYILVSALMQIHEAIRLDGMSSKIAATEAMEAFDLSKFRLHVQEDMKKRTFKKSELLEPPVTISDCRHYVDRKTKTHAEGLAIKYSNENDYDSWAEIAKIIMGDVNDYACNTLKRKNPYKLGAIDGWVRGVVKSRSKKTDH